MQLQSEDTLAGAAGINGPKSDKKDYSIAETNYLRYIRARDNGHTDYVRDATKFDRFYCGDQWNPQDKAKLDKEGRPTLTINMIRASVNAVLGEQIAQRAEIKFKHKRGGSEDIATLLSKLYQSIGDDNDLDYVESQVFADGIIQDRGYFDVRIAFTENMRGEVTITCKDPKDVLLDPDAKEYDPATWSEVFTTGWMSLDEISSTYGQAKADELKECGNGSRYFTEDSMLFEDQRFGETLQRGDDAIQSQNASDTNREIRKIRVIDRQYYKLTQVKYFVDPETGDAKMVSADWDDARATEFAAQYGLFLNRRMERRVRWTVTADHVVLHDAWSPYSTFTIVPYFPFFRRGRPVGMVRDLISPQELLNKVSSQELHIVNTTANSGYIVEDGTLSNMTTDDLKTKGSQTGVVITVARGRKDGLEKIQPNTIPTGLDRIGSKAANNFRMISGVNEAMLGLESPEVSGIAIESKKSSGSVQVEVPLSNLSLTRRIIARKILELIQNFYTEERVIQVIDHIHPDRPADEITMNQMTAIGEVLNDITVGEYEVVVSTQPARDNYADSQFAELIGLRTAGVMIPDDRVIERSNLEDKFSLAKEVRELTGRGDPTPEQQQMAMIQQQMMLQRAQLELRELEAGIADMQSRAQLHRAKAMAIPAEFQQKQDELEAKVQIKREEIQLRQRLQTLNSVSKLDTAAMGHSSKINQMVLEHKLGDKNINGG